MLRNKDSKEWPMKLFITITVVVVCYLAYTYANQVYRDYEIQRQIEESKQEIVELQMENEKMTDYINYLRSEEYKEKKAKQILNLKNPGETVIVFEDNFEEIDITTQSKQDDYIKSLSPTRRWYEFFFGDLSIRDTNM